MTEATSDRAGTAAGVCLLCCRPVGAAERRCPAFALAGIAAHAGCCGGCTVGPARPEPAAGRLEAA
jgi:hypothetical protein